MPAVCVSIVQMHEISFIIILLIIWDCFYCFFSNPVIFICNIYALPIIKYMLVITHVTSGSFTFQNTQRLH